MIRPSVFASTAVAVASITSLAGADDVGAAAAAFAQGQTAQLAGDHARAAEFYELADAAAPSPEALRASLRARKASGRPDLAATHAELLLERYPTDASSKALAGETLGDLAPQLVRYVIACTPDPCRVLLDGSAIGTRRGAKHVFYARPGSHSVAAAFSDGRAPARSSESRAGEQLKLDFVGPAKNLERSARAAPRSSPPRSTATTSTVDADVGEGLSPWWFTAGAALTVGLAAVTVWSGLDTMREHRAYEKNPSLDGYDEGTKLERRTNLLLIGTGVSALATAGIGVFLVDWQPGTRGGEAARRGAFVKLGPRGGALNVAAGMTF